MNINTAIGLIPFSDLTQSGILSFTNNKPQVDKEKLESYIKSDYAKTKYTAADLNNMTTGLKHYDNASLETAFNQMGITSQEVQDNPNGLVSQYFRKYTENFSKQAQEHQTAAEKELHYDGQDVAKVKPQLALI